MVGFNVTALPTAVALRPLVNATVGLEPCAIDWNATTDAYLRCQLEALPADTAVVNNLMFSIRLHVGPLVQTVTGFVVSYPGEALLLRHFPAPSHPLRSPARQIFLRSTRFRPKWAPRMPRASECQASCC